MPILVAWTGLLDKIPGTVVCKLVDQESGDECWHGLRHVLCERLAKIKVLVPEYIEDRAELRDGVENWGQDASCAYNLPPADSQKPLLSEPTSDKTENSCQHARNLPLHVFGLRPLQCHPRSRSRAEIEDTRVCEEEKGNGTEGLGSENESTRDSAWVSSLTLQVSMYTYSTYVHWP